MAEGTCYLPNGKVVAGGQASCQANGGTWVASGGTAPVQDDRNRLQKIGGWIAEHPIQAATYGLGVVGTGGLGLGAIAGGVGLRAGTKALLSKMAKSRLGQATGKSWSKPAPTIYSKQGAMKPSPATKLDWNKPNTIGMVDRFGRVLPSRQVPKFGPYAGPALSKYGLPASKEGGRQLSKLKAGSLGAFGLSGAVGLGGYMAGSDERKAALNANIEQNILNAQKDVDAKQKVIDDAQKEKDRVAGLSDWERTFEKMKDPNYWRESMSGLPHDTRLMRLAQLMDYYGKTPKQRAAVDSPSENWAQMETDVATNKAALEKAQATLMGKSEYTKPGVSDIADVAYDRIEELYGDSMPWIPGGQRKEEEIERIAKAAAQIFIDLTNDPQNLGVAKGVLMEEAIIQVGEDMGL